MCAELLGKDFDAGHGRIALDRNETQKQFALGVGFKARKSADDHIRLARLCGRIEAPEERISIAEYIEDMSDWAPVLAGCG